MSWNLACQYGNLADNTYQAILATTGFISTPVTLPISNVTPNVNGVKINGRMVVFSDMMNAS